jgi:hypothetical protein
VTAWSSGFGHRSAFPVRIAKAAARSCGQPSIHDERENIDAIDGSRMLHEVRGPGDTGRGAEGWPRARVDPYDLAPATEVGGHITLTYSAASDANQSVDLAFGESSLYVGIDSDRSNGSSHPEGAFTAAARAGTVRLTATAVTQQPTPKN